MRELEELDVHSMYHEHSGEEQGQEKAPTFFLQKKREKPYHIDYAFVSKPMMDSGNLEVGDPDQWLEISYHMPIVFNVSLPEI